MDLSVPRNQRNCEVCNKPLRSFATNKRTGKTRQVSADSPLHFRHDSCQKAVRNLGFGVACERMRS